MIGHNIKLSRIFRGFTQENLAEILEKSVNTISDYENDKTIPPLEVLVKISDILQVSLNDLIGEDQERSYSEKIEQDIIEKLNEQEDELLQKALDTVFDIYKHQKK